MKRRIIRIDEEKCDGCGLCVPGCHEGALQVIDGKARLVKESYCDGLGDCLGECPRGAISIEEREADPYDENAVAKHLAHKDAPCPPSGCPGAASMSFDKPEPKPVKAGGAPSPSMLRQWPVQLHLVSPMAPYWKGADILVAASCVPVSFGDFQNALLKDRRIVIACPKLDRTEGYVEKLTEIFRRNDVSSVTVAHMEVPCCSGLVSMVEQALSRCGKVLPYRRVKIGIKGEMLESV